MFLHQALAYMATLVLPVIAPLVARELGVDSAFIGIYSALLYCAAMASVMLNGTLFLRYGALRVSQVALFVMAIGLAVATSGSLVLLAMSAMVIGIGTASSTPAGSHILARYCPPRHAPLIFSIKQTGVPFGGVLVGLIVPFLALRIGWQGASLAIAGLFVAYAVLLQPLRSEFDRERQPGRTLSPADVRETLRAVTTIPELRMLTFASFAFVGLQVCIQTFFVSYLADGLGWPLTAAGSLFAVSQGVAIFTRILWGWLGSRLVPPWLVLAGLGFTMAAASVATGLYTAAWSVTAVTIVAVVFSATAVSWHGVLYAELARLAPPGLVGSVTSGVIFFAFIAMMIYPAIYGAILGTTGSYAYGFFAGAVPALLASLKLLRPGRSDGATSPK
jgi:MFS family permease